MNPTTAVDTTLEDLSGKGNDGTINGPTWVFPGPVMNFDGVDDNVSLPSFSALSAYTVVLLSYHESVADGDTDNDFMIDDTNSFQMRDEGDSTFYLYQYDGAWSSITSSISNGTWNVWVGRWDGSTLELFKNAASQGTTAVGLTGRGNTPNMIGSTWVPDQFLDGGIALFLFYNVAKSNSWIENITAKLGYL